MSDAAFATMWLVLAEIYIEVAAQCNGDLRTYARSQAGIATAIATGGTSCNHT